MKELITWLAWIASGAGGILILIEVIQAIRVKLNKKAYILYDDRRVLTVPHDCTYFYCLPKQKGEFIVLTMVNIVSLLTFIGSTWLIKFSVFNTGLIILGGALLIISIFGWQKSDAMLMDLGTVEIRNEILKEKQENELIR